jgi:predicted  nucleic acid-binding Zn-ribbon protein
VEPVHPSRWPRRLAVLLLLLASAGCASWPIVGPALLLVRADQQAREGAWHDAVASYDAFLARYPDDRAAPRVLESRDTLAAMLAARAELSRRRDEVAQLNKELSGLRDEGTRLREDHTKLRAEASVLRDEVIRLHGERTKLREELTRREGDLARTRQELAARRAELAAWQAEADRLRADIERLKEIDLKLERKR